MFAALPRQPIHFFLTGDFVDISGVRHYLANFSFKRQPSRQFGASRRLTFLFFSLARQRKNGLWFTVILYKFNIKIQLASVSLILQFSVLIPVAATN